MIDPKAVLAALPGVTSRRLGAREGFFAAGRMFALLDRTSLLLRLPSAAGADLLARYRARSVVGIGVPAQHSWVEVVPVDTDQQELLRLASEARDAVRRVGRGRGTGRTRPRRRRQPA